VLPSEPNASNDHRETTDADQTLVALEPEIYLLHISESLEQGIVEIRLDVTLELFELITCDAGALAEVEVGCVQRLIQLRLIRS
jgi:hypothetical protein